MFLQLSVKAICFLVPLQNQITRSRVHESPGNETIIEVFWPVEFWIEEKMAIFGNPENYRDQLIFFEQPRDVLRAR